MRRDLIHQPLNDVAVMHDRASPGAIMGRIFYEHAGAVADKWGHYLDVYDRFLSRFRGAENVRFLEIGVQAGGSLQIWRRYFGPSAKLHGLDIAPLSSAQTALASVDAQLHVGNQVNGDTLREIVFEMGGVDVVIDDGGHVCADQIASFETLYPLLSDRGVYICEDTHTSYWPEYGGGSPDYALAAPYGAATHGSSFIEYAKRRVDELHAWHTDSVVEETFARRTQSVSFYDSLVIFERGVRTAPRRSVVGS